MFGRSTTSGLVDFVTLYQEEDGIHPDLAKACTWAKETIFDELYDKPYKAQVFLAGGALRSYFTQTPVNDFDLYTLKDDTRENMLRNLKLKNFREISNTDKSVVLQRAIWKDLQLSVKDANVIKKPYQTMTDLLDSFDFTICMCGIEKKSDSFSITYHPDYFLDLVGRKLVTHNLTNPIGALWRVQKYTRMGFTIDREEMWKIVEAVHELPSLPAVGYGPMIDRDKGEVALEDILSSS